MSALDQAIAAALALVGAPYQVGGLRAHPNNPAAGLDCSELVALAFAKIGINLPWNAQQQANVTQQVSSPQAGDLVFFHGTDPSNLSDYVTHVGIYLGANRMVNAENKGVAIADLTSPYWVEHLAGYGRVPGAGAATGQPVGLTLPGGGSVVPQGVSDLVSALQRRDTWVRVYLVVAGATVVVVGAALALWPVERPAVEALL